MGTRQSTRTRLLDATDALVFAAGDTHAPATLYRAYGSRDALVAAALERRQREWLEVWDAAVARADTDRERLLAVFDALEEFQSRPDGARWCAFLGTAAGYADPPAELAEAVRLETTSLRQRLHALSEPVAGARSAELVEALVLVFSGLLATRLRPGSSPGPRTSSGRTARHLAALVVDDHGA